MTKYITQERAKYLPISRKLMAKYKDGLHTHKNSFGGLYWNKNGLLHRNDDKPAVIDVDGTLQWRQNGQLHRDGDKPAFIGSNWTLDWCQNGNRHRACGPAVIYSDGKLEWWINDENITLEVKKWLNRKRWRGTPEQIAEFQLRFT